MKNIFNASIYPFYLLKLYYESLCRTDCHVGEKYKKGELSVKTMK